MPHNSPLPQAGEGRGVRADGIATAAKLNCGWHAPCASIRVRCVYLPSHTACANYDKMPFLGIFRALTFPVWRHLYHGS